MPIQDIKKKQLSAKNKVKQKAKFQRYNQEDQLIVDSSLKQTRQMKQNNKLQEMAIKYKQSYQPGLFAFQEDIHPVQQQLVQQIKLIDLTPKQIVNSLMTQIADNIFDQIRRDTIKMPLKSAKLDKFIQKNQESEVHQQQLLKRQYQNLIHKKQQARQQLIDLEQQEQDLKRYKSSAVIKYQKVKYQMSESQKQRWNQFRVLQRMHNLQFRKKKKIYEEQSKRYRQEQIKLQHQKNQQKSEQKRRILSLKINQIQQRHDERTSHIQEQKRIIERLKSKKKLFQKMEQQFIANNQKLQNQHYQTLMDQYKSKRNVDMNQIKNHQKTHQQSLEQKQISRKRRMSQLIGKAPSMFHSRFLQNVLQQDNNQKLAEAQKFSQIKDLYDKKKDYAKIVNEKFKPKSRLQAHIQQVNGMKSSRSMSAFEIQKKGNEYMKKVNQSLTNLKHKLHNSKTRNQPKQEVFKYKNYLKQFKMRQTTNINKTDKNRQIQIIQQIMKKQNMTQQEKIYEARVIAQSIQGKGPQRVLDSINAKIQILKKLGS